MKPVALRLPKNNRSQASSKNENSDIFIAKIEGSAIVCEGMIVSFRVTKFNRSNFLLGEISNIINWGYALDDGKITQISQKGFAVSGKMEVVLKWKIPKLTNGGFLKVFAWIKKPNEGVNTSAEILHYPFLFDKYRKKGLDRFAENIADDMCYGNGVTINEHFRYTTAEVEALDTDIKNITMMSTTEGLWIDFELMVNVFFTSIFYLNLKSAALSMVAKFKKNEGGVFTNTVLTNAVLNHEMTVIFCKRIEAGIQIKIKENKGFVPALKSDNIYLNSNRYGRPSFNTVGNIISGLTIMVNDTWAYKVVISYFNTNDGINYEIKYKVILYDHFGLDMPDLQAHPERLALAGFKAWFVLQHIRNYKPFITEIAFEKTFKGNINKVQS